MKNYQKIIMQKTLPLEKRTNFLFSPHKQYRKIKTHKKNNIHDKK